MKSHVRMIEQYLLFLMEVILGQSVDLIQIGGTHHMREVRKDEL